MIQNTIQKGVKRLTDEKEALKESRMLHISDAIRVIAPYDKDVAKELFTGLDETNITGNVVNLSYYILAAKSLGYSLNQMKPYTETIEKKRIGGEWSSEIWVNALVLRALGSYGISYPKYADGLLKHRLINGSWFNKIWVSAFSLMALYYCNASEDEIKKTLSYLKNHINDQHWKEYNDQRVAPFFSTSLALEGILLIGEGYEEEPIKDVVTWCIKQVESTKISSELARLLVPLVFIDSGRASKKTTLHASNPVVFRETKVSIGTQVQGDYVQTSGDYITGDKVDRKLGDGAVDMRDAVVHRSNVTAGEPTEQESFQVCPFCGKNLKNIGFKKTPRFCPYCGEKLTQSL